jgi:hypothetical protein
MDSYIDESLWRQCLSQPNWYELLASDFKRLEDLAAKEVDYNKRKRIKDEAYGLVEQALVHNTIPLASVGPDLDAERQPIDTIVIHHTKNQPGMTLARLNAMQLLRIYGMYYNNPSDPRETEFKGQPIWSGHFQNEQQLFWGYHWLIRNDGQVNNLLNDLAIGWHAGNWDVNKRSIAVCIDDDLTESEPKDAVLESIADLIESKYPYIDKARIIGHSDANSSTECPGNSFHDVWRAKLLSKFS